MTLVALAHITLACGAGLCALVVALRPDATYAVHLRRAAGLCAVVSLGLAVTAQRAFEAGRLRAVYSNSRSAGALLERHAHFGFAALCFAVALALLSSSRSAKAQRWLAGLTVLFTVAALFCDALVHARVPLASIE